VIRLAAAAMAALLASPAAAYTVLAMAADPAGNVWITGRDDANSVVPTANAIQSKFRSGNCGAYPAVALFPPSPIVCGHAFVMELDPTGKVLYASYLGGSSDDAGRAIALDASGNVYIAGYTYSQDFPVTTGAFQTKAPGTPGLIIGAGPVFGTGAVFAGGDAFAAKIRPDGSLAWCTYVGGTGQDYASVLAVDGSGSVYIAGATTSADFPATPGAFRAVQGSRPAFVARLNPAGSALIYATYYDAPVSAMALDPAGAAYLAGWSDGSLTTTAGALQQQYGGGGEDGYVAKLDAAGASQVFATHLGAGGSDFASAIAADSTGAVWVGMTTGGGFPNKTGRAGGLAVKLGADGGSILASAAFGNGAPNDVSFLAVDGNDNVMLSGSGTSVPATPNALLASPCPGVDGYLMRVDSTGQVLDSTLLRQTAAIIAGISPGRAAVLPSTSQAAFFTIDLAVPPPLNFGCVLNLATLQPGPGITVGEIVTVEGYGLGPQQAVSAQLDATGHLPTTLAGVQLLLNGIPAPLLMVQNAQINAVVPVKMNLSVTITAQVIDSGQIAPILDVSGIIGSVGVFTTNAAGQGAILNQDLTVNTPSHPAKLGSYVAIYATGIDMLNTGLVDGEIVPLSPLLKAPVPPAVTFAGVAGTVVFAGAAPGLVAGVEQINVQLPASLPAGTNLSAVPMIVNAGLDDSAPVVYISVAQ